MSLILLHRLKFPIKDDVLLLMLFTLLCTLKTTLSTTKTAAVAIPHPQPHSSLPPLSFFLPTSTPTAPLLATETPSTTTALDDVHPRGYPIYGHNFNEDYDADAFYAKVQKILRNSESLYRNENLRWKSVRSRDTMDRRMYKRAADDATAPSSATTIQNSTKILNYSNRSMEQINFSDLSGGGGDVTRQFSDILVLNLSNNKISVVNESSVSAALAANLELLDLSANRLLVFAGKYNKLTALYLSENRLDAFDSVNTPNLRTLDMSANRASDPSRVNLSYANALESVDLSCNSFRELHRTLFRNTTNLKVLNLSDNWLVRILKNYFFNLVNVERLLLSRNNISDIENDTFAYLPNLQYLDLSHNDIDAMSIRALQGIPDLVGLSVAFNPRLGNALQGFVASWSLKELDASGTGLCQIPAALAQSVHTLNVSHNHFQVSSIMDIE